MKTTELRELLRKRFAAPTYGMLEEVPSATGAGAVRTADALVMGLWPSRGLELWGLELKVSRSDWLHEVKKPEKAETICRYCDRWFVVAGEDGIVQPGELPPTWGLMVAQRGRIVDITPAPRLSPEPISRAFLASLFRKVATQDDEKIAELVEAKKSELKQQAYEEAKMSYRSMSEAHSQLSAQVREFEESSGIKMGWWIDGKKLGGAVRLVMDDQVRKHYEDLHRLHQSAQRITNSLSSLMAELDDPETALNGSLRKNANSEF